LEVVVLSALKDGSLRKATTKKAIFTLATRIYSADKACSSLTFA
jgi:hypothetical protein